MAEMSDIEGSEFDWLCTDRQGRWGIIATGGHGPVPQQVLSVAEVHDALVALIEVVNWGTKDVWKSYADAGLFVYDWDDEKGMYARLCAPMAPTNDDLVFAIQHAADAIPRLDIDFDDAEVIRLD